ncbi:unnamed protein product [Cylicocyclus nassatus]|uniref:Uncharacterized protein n=1 Tax=Cylicocyclus nassatus TaxID=53992 RepID=A0AA36GN98_CYLNA|nr:unnamed protein product [Cylicocyclus nassatus]
MRIRGTQDNHSDALSTYYENIARITDETLAKANRLLGNLEPIRRDLKSPNRENNCVGEHLLINTENGTDAHLPLSSDESRCSAGNDYSTEGFKNYVDTPSRFLSKSVSCQQENHGNKCLCTFIQPNLRSREKANARELEHQYACALEQWLKSSRINTSCGKSSTTVRSPSSSSPSRMMSGRELKISRGDSKAPRICSKHKRSLRKLVDRYTSYSPRRKSKQETQIGKEEANNGLAFKESIRHGCVTIMQADNVYFKCRCGHVCKYPVKISSPRSSMCQWAASSSCEKSVENKRGTSLRTARSPRARGISSRNTSASETKKVEREFRRRTFAAKEKDKGSAVKKTAFSPKVQSTGFTTRTRSISSQTDPTLGGRLPRSGVGLLAKALTERKSLTGANATVIKTARANSPRRRPDSILFDATFRVKDQETDELHTLILNAEMQGNLIKRLIINGKECKVDCT